MSWLVLHLSAYPSDFPVFSFSSCTGKLNSAVSSVLPLLLVPCQPQHKTTLIPSFTFFVNLCLPLSHLKSPNSQSLVLSSSHLHLNLPRPSCPILFFSLLFNHQITRSLASVSWARVATCSVALGERHMFWRLMAWQSPFHFVSIIVITKTVYAFITAFPSSCWM